MANITLHNNGTISDINNLKFYTARGYEIPMQKTYVLTWEFIPGKLASQYIQSIPKGFFMCSVFKLIARISLLPFPLFLHQ